METIFWFAGVLAVWTGLKFVFMVFKRLGSKNSMNDMLDRMESGMQEGADRLAKKMKEKRQQKHDDDRPIVTIR